MTGGERQHHCESVAEESELNLIHYYEVRYQVG
ncbi:hypothetical protein DET50_113110 [Marinobacter pelagius]|uniref:Uncharacterized protein n=1 Tax=Marinobacter pelagius TaxID=379482 RepID=A0A366GL51_9GAMM|nr:hypothetical protein DET50_113110 [Marinobacter pelagius]